MPLSPTALYAFHHCTLGKEPLLASSWESVTSPLILSASKYFQRDCHFELFYSTRSLFFTIQNFVFRLGAIQPFWSVFQNTDKFCLLNVLFFGDMGVNEQKWTSSFALFFMLKKLQWDAITYSIYIYWEVGKRWQGTGVMKVLLHLDIVHWPLIILDYTRPLSFTRWR